MKDSIDGLTGGLADLRDELSVQNQILRESLDAQRDVKKLVHLMFVFLFNFTASNRLIQECIVIA